MTIVKAIAVLILWIVLGAGLVRGETFADSTGTHSVPANADSNATHGRKGATDQFIDKDGDGIADGRAAGLGLKRRGWQNKKAPDPMTSPGKGRYRGGRR